PYLRPEDRSVAEQHQLREALQSALELRQAGVVIEAEVATAPIGAVEDDGQADILGVPEEVLHQVVPYLQVGHHLAQAPAAPIAVVAQQVAQRGVSAVGERS